MKNLIVLLALLLSVQVYGQKIVNAYEATYEYAHVNNIPHVTDYITQDIQIQSDYVNGTSNYNTDVYVTTPVGVGRGQAQVLSVPRATKYVDYYGYGNVRKTIKHRNRAKEIVLKTYNVNYFDFSYTPEISYPYKEY